MAREYTSAAQNAASIRVAFKKLGWGRSHVSVTCSNYSMGSSVSVRIKSPEVDKDRAEQIARDAAESIARCEITGDILNGGNRYVHVDHTSECQAVMARRYWDALADAARRLGDDRSAIERVTEEIGVSRDGAGWLKLWIGDRGGLSFPDDLTSEHQSGFTSGAYVVALEMDRIARESA